MVKFEMYLFAYWNVIFFKKHLCKHLRPIHTNDDTYNYSFNNSSNLNGKWKKQQLTANQNPPDFKQLKHLKRQKT